jgi:biotin operon repressor
MPLRWKNNQDVEKGFERFKIMFRLIIALTDRPMHMYRIAQLIGCTERTAYRYVNAVKDLGFEVKRTRVGHQIKSWPQEYQRVQQKL